MTMLREFTRLPNLEAVQDFEELAVLIEEHERTHKEFRQGKVEHERLEAELSAARKKDKQARVEAHRKGKADPGRKHEERVLAKLREVEDSLSVREGAYSAVERDISQLVSKKRAEWLPQVEALVDEDSAKLGELLSEVREVQLRRQRHRGLAEWFKTLPPAYQSVVYAQGGITEDVAYNALLGSTAKEVEHGAA
jgi:seryl-tRNA synthetase